MGTTIVWIARKRDDSYPRCKGQDEVRVHLATHNNMQLKTHKLFLAFCIYKFLTEVITGS